MEWEPFLGNVWQASLVSGLCRQANLGSNPSSVFLFCFVFLAVYLEQVI